jgi:glycosyltransferase involved in cell wall biosynthesis
MKISFDLRFAHLPCGGRTHVQVIFSLIAMHPQTHWRLYYNDWCDSQMEIVGRLRSLHSRPVEQGDIEFVPVKRGCLTLGQHVEFFKFRDDATLYHYLNFDMPVGMRGIARVVTIHDLYPLTLAGYCSRAKRAYFGWINRRSCERAERVIAVSEHTKKDIIENPNIPEEKIKVIYQGFSERFQPVEDQEALGRIRQRYQLPERFILYTGTHKPHKNLMRLVEAFARLDRRFAEVALVMTGPITRDSELLKAKAEALGVVKRLHFKGLVAMEDLPGIYTLADLYVLASLYEGFGIPPLEAMACGTAVACSKATAIPEVVGDAGRLFDPYSVDDIATTISQTLEQDVNNSQVRKKCLDQAAKFSWAKMAKKTYPLYESVAGGSASH